MTRRSLAIVLASGTGKRFQSETPKQFMKLAGKTVLEHTLDIFEQHSAIDEIIVVTAAEHLLLVEEITTAAGYLKVTKVITGGHTRQESSASGIAAVLGDEDKVLVHDAVRPLLDDSTIDRCLEALDEFDAVDTGIPSSDTIIQVSGNDTIADIPARAELRLGQTPQGFRARILRQAHAQAAAECNLNATDDCSLILRYGLAPIKVVLGNVNNIKITYPSDIYLADRIFQVRTRPMTASGTFQLEDKVVVVFGGSRGIGKRIAALAESNGARVRSVSRRDGIDVSNPESVRLILHEMRDSHGHLDAVINTAGVLRTGLLVGQEYPDIDEQLSTNLRGSVVVAREAFSLMQDSGGSIALFASSSYTRGRARSSVYSATKAAVVNLVQGLAQEFRPFGVRINAINPERTATPMRSENFGKEIPAELLDPDTVASATLSAVCSHASGEVIDVRLP